jgi:hypothetical protein
MLNKNDLFGERDFDMVKPDTAEEKIRLQNRELQGGIKSGYDADEFGSNTREELGRHTEIFGRNRKRVFHYFLFFLSQFLVTRDTGRVICCKFNHKYNE